MKVDNFVLEELFSFPAISSGMTEEFARKNSGDIPVYGGRKTETPLSYIQEGLPGIKYFSNCLAWNREGSVGYVFYHKHKFTTNDHHRPMELKKEYEKIIDLDYCRIVIENELLNMGLEWGKTASKEKVSKVEISVPVNEKGIPDIKLQKDYAKRINNIKKIQDKIEYYNKRIEDSLISIDNQCDTRTISLGNEEYFSLSIGKRVLKKDVLSVGIPLYSANVMEVFGYISKSNINDFTKPSLIWGIDGNFDWNFIEEGKEFATTDHCGRLQVLDENISAKYIYYTLRKNSVDEGFSRTYRASTKRIKENVTIDIPINCEGKFDMDVQNNIVKKYDYLYKLKDELNNKLKLLTNIKIECN